MSYKGHGLSVSTVKVRRLMRHEPKQAKIDEHERGITMSKKNTTTASTMTAAEFKQKSYDAYLAYVEFIEGKKSIIETVEALSPLMSVYGFALTADNLANLLTVKMTAYGKDKGEQAKKVKSAMQRHRRSVRRGAMFLSAARLNFATNEQEVLP